MYKAHHYSSILVADVSLAWNGGTHSSHEGGLSIGHQHKHVCIQTVFVDPLIHIRVHVNTRTGETHVVGHIIHVPHNIS